MSAFRMMRHVVVYAASLVLCSGCGGEGLDYKGQTEYMTVDTLDGLCLYYPAYRSISLVCGNPPAEGDSTVTFCCGAAFTKGLSFNAGHDDIGGIHTVGGRLFSGYDCRECDGGFVAYGCEWHIITDSVAGHIRAASERGGVGFCQMVVLPERKPRRPCGNEHFRIGNVRCYTDVYGTVRVRRVRHRYRALCEIDGRLCVAEMKRAVGYSDFVRALKAAHVSRAIYLDTGFGWGYCWYRQTADKVVVPHPYVHPFGSNWLVFRN